MSLRARAVSLYSSPDVEGQVQGDMCPIPSSPYSALPSGPGPPTTVMLLRLPLPQPTPTTSPLPREPDSLLASLPSDTFPQSLSSKLSLSMHTILHTSEDKYLFRFGVGVGEGTS